MSAQSSVAIPRTAVEWQTVLDRVQVKASSPYTQKDVRVLWCQGIIVLLSGVLYLASLVRRAKMEGGAWCIKKDMDGYWHPNVHVAIPIVAIVYAAIQSASIGLILIDGGEEKSPLMVALNLIACSTLYFAGWTKVWVVIYALPSSIFRLRRRNVLGSTAMITKRRILSPKILNGFVLAGYLVGLLPIPALFYTVYRITDCVDKLIKFRNTVTELISQLSTSTNGTPKTLLLSLQAGQHAQDLEKAQLRALKNLRIFSGVWLAISFSALVIFLAGSFALFLALTRQIEIFSKIQKQRELLMTRHTSHPGKQLHRLRKKNSRTEVDKQSRKTLYSRISSWLPSLSDNDEEDPLATPCATAPPQFHIGASGFTNEMWAHGPGTDPATLSKARSSVSGGFEELKRLEESSRKTKKRLTDYCVRFTWQTIFCTLISASFIVLNVFVAFNVFDAPRSLSLSQLLRTIEQWAAWSWGGGPGAILGLLACVVAFSRTTALPQEPQSGPPIPKKNHGDQDGDDGDEEEFYGANTVDLTVEKLHLHSTSQKTGLPASAAGLSQPLSTITTSSWGQLRAKLGLPSNSTPSASIPSKAGGALSDAGTGISRSWSPFQIMSINSSNVVTKQTARPYQLSKLHYAATNKGRMNSEHSSLPEELDVPSPCPIAYHYPTGLSHLHSIKSHPLSEQITRSGAQGSGATSRTSFTPDMPQSPGSDQNTGGYFNAIKQLRNQT